MIRACSEAEVPVVESIINEAARAYQGVIPADCWQEPYMPRAELLAEIASGVRFWGWDDSGALIGVMGIQKVHDATLIRHAYVRAAHQSRGIGGALLDALVGQSTGKLLVGTWAAAKWAIRFYQQRGFQLVQSEEKDRLLSTYWNISQRQRQTSVVLMYAGAQHGEGAREVGKAKMKKAGANEKADDTCNQMARRHSGRGQLQCVFRRRIQGDRFRPSTKPRRVSEFYSDAVRRAL